MIAVPSENHMAHTHYIQNAEFRQHCGQWRTT
jgi:hypothetical protein